ncbi:MAG: hypothetical protein HY216_14475 [Candidatus Rokubacteria bacterium]|nr:hypothetical protein [Candidatus Rokubacteria bacterium]
MHLWAEIVLVACAVGLTVGLLAAVAALRRTAERAERVVALVEHDLPPLIGEVRDITKELAALGREARGDLERMRALLDRAHDVAEGVGRVAGAVAGFTRAGQLVGLAAGLKSGVDVFLHRLRQQGDHHE